MLLSFYRSFYLLRTLFFFFFIAFHFVYSSLFTFMWMQYMKMVLCKWKSVYFSSVSSCSFFLFLFLLFEYVIFTQCGWARTCLTTIKKYEMETNHIKPESFENARTRKASTAKGKFSVIFRKSFKFICNRKYTHSACCIVWKDTISWSLFFVSVRDGFANQQHFKTENQQIVVKKKKKKE